MDPGDGADQLWKAMIDALRETRLARRLSLRELSKEIGVHYAHLGRVEKCNALPNVVLAIRWSRALQIDFATLYRAALLAVEDSEVG